jgi:hypothetical protein
MATNEKGLNRGGVGGQEGELGEDSKNLDVNRPESGSLEQPGQQRGGMQGGSGKNAGLIRDNLNPAGSSQRDMNQQRGGLRREPDLTDAEKDTGHEVD